MSTGQRTDSEIDRRKRVLARILAMPASTRRLLVLRWLAKLQHERVKASKVMVKWYDAPLQGGMREINAGCLLAAQALYEHCKLEGYLRYRYSVHPSEVVAWLKREGYADA